MRRKNAIFVLMCIALVAGCASLRQRGAIVEGRVISNPSLGFFGFSFDIPEGFDLYDPAVGGREQLGELQQLAVRIYDLNRDYHPRGNEIFYDSFLMLSEKSGVLLMTMKVIDVPFSGTDFFEDSPQPQVESIPLYNISAQQTLQIGINRAVATCTRGHAYEQKGWYYAKDRRNGIQFQYEACKVSGSNRDRYVLMGFCLPGDEDVLRLQMQSMVQALRF